MQRMCDQAIMQSMAAKKKYEGKKTTALPKADLARIQELKKPNEVSKGKDSVGRWYQVPFFLAGQPLQPGK
jgi:hypothetical protein